MDTVLRSGQMECLCLGAQRLLAFRSMSRALSPGPRPRIRKAACESKSYRFTLTRQPEHSLSKAYLYLRDSTSRLHSVWAPAESQGRLGVGSLMDIQTRRMDMVIEPRTGSIGSSQL